MVAKTDTNFNVRRQFVKTLTSNGDETFTAGTNETFVSHAADDYTVTIMTLALVALVLLEIV